MVDSEHPVSLLRRIREGESGALGQLMEMYRNYLRLLARTQIDPDLRVRIDESDLVQDTLMEAHRDFPQFQGDTEVQLIGWLRKILVRNLASQVKRHHAQMRDLRREIPFGERLDRSSMRLDRLVSANISTPSAQAANRESSVILADVLAKLPSDYRDVIIMRHLEELPFSDIATRMDRTSGAVRMLWVRALERLRKELEESS